MSKLTLLDLANLSNETAAISSINSNNTTIETALDNTLSRDGTSPNSMAASLDMNSHRILNLPAPVTNQEPIRLQEFNAVARGTSVIPAAGPSTVGGIFSNPATTHQFVTGTDTFGNLTKAQPASTDVSGLGTAATLNVGTSANNIVQLTAASKLPAVDGSLVTNLTLPATLISTTGAQAGMSTFYDTISSKYQPSWRSPNGFNLDLRDAMDSYYGRNSWTLRTGVGTGSDIGVAITQALTNLRSAGVSFIRVLIPPTGLWLMNTPISATYLAGCSVEGMVPNSQGCQIVFNNANGVMFLFNGAGGFTGGGLKHLTLYLESGKGSSNSTAVQLQGGASFQPDQMEFRDLYITSLGVSDLWFNGWYHDGTQRTTPQGSRVGTGDNIQIFRCRNLGAYFANVVQWSYDNFGTYVGTGTGMDIEVTGLGTATTNTIQFSLTRLACGGALQLTNCSNVKIDGRATSLVTDSTATYINGWLNAPTTTGTIGVKSNLTVQT